MLTCRDISKYKSYPTLFVVSISETSRVILGRELCLLIIAPKRCSDETENRNEAALEQTVKDIRRATWKHDSTEEKIRAVPQGVSDECCSAWSPKT